MCLRNVQLKLFCLHECTFKRIEEQEVSLMAENVLDPFHRCQQSKCPSMSVISVSAHKQRLSGLETLTLYFCI